MRLVPSFLKTNFFATDDREQGDERALDDAPTTLIEQLERDGADEIVRTKYAGRDDGSGCIRGRPEAVLDVSREARRKHLHAVQRGAVLLCGVS